MWNFQILFEDGPYKKSFPYKLFAFIISSLDLFRFCHEMQKNRVKGLKRVLSILVLLYIVKLRRGSGKDWQGMALKVKGLKA